MVYGWIVVFVSCMSQNEHRDVAKQNNDTGFIETIEESYNPENEGRLPVLIWAYPREYTSKKVASQVRNSPYRFTRISYGSPIFWALRGYAVMASTEMPIVGFDGDQPNDSFRKQLVMNAEAAINKIVDMGIGDRYRVGVGGHSYGAFMTANLLAHTMVSTSGSRILPV